MYIIGVVGLAKLARPGLSGTTLGRFVWFWRIPGFSFAFFGFFRVTALLCFGQMRLDHVAIRLVAAPVIFVIQLLQIRRVEPGAAKPTPSPAPLQTTKPLFSVAYLHEQVIGRQCNLCHPLPQSSLTAFPQGKTCVNTFCTMN